MIRLAVLAYATYQLVHHGHPGFAGVLVIVSVVWAVQHYNDTHPAPFGIGTLW